MLAQIHLTPTCHTMEPGSDESVGEEDAFDESMKQVKPPALDDEEDGFVEVQIKNTVSDSSESQTPRRRKVPKDLCQRRRSWNGLMAGIDLLSGLGLTRV